MAGTPDITQVKASYICQSVHSTGVGESKLNALECIEVDAIAEGSIAEIAPTQDIYRWDPASLAAPGATVVIPLGQALGTPGRWVLVAGTTPTSAYYQYINGIPLSSTLIPSSGIPVAAIQQSTLTFKNGDITDNGVNPTGFTQLTLHNQQVWFTDILGATVAENKRARIRFVASDITPANVPVDVKDEPATDTTVVTIYRSLAASAPWSAVLALGNVSGGNDAIMDGASHFQLTDSSVMDVASGCSIDLTTVAQITPGTNQGVFAATSNPTSDTGGSVLVKKNPAAGMAGDAEILGGTTSGGVAGAGILVGGGLSTAGGAVTVTSGAGSATVVGGNVTISLPSTPFGTAKGPGDFSVQMGACNDATTARGSIQMQAANNTAGATQVGSLLTLSPGSPAGATLAGGAAVLRAGDGTALGGQLTLSGGRSTANTAGTLYIVGATAARAGYTQMYQPLSPVALASDPASLGSAGQLYAKTVSGADHLFWETQGGTVYQITPPGASPVPWISMPDCNTVNSINGFYNRTDSTISANDGTLTFSIAPSGVSYQIYSYTYPYTKSGTETKTWTDTEGQWWFYYDSAGVLQSTNSSTTVQTVLTNGAALVAQIYWDATNKVIVHNADERHGFMNTPTHIWAHETIGALWVSGGALVGFTIGNGNTDTHAQFACQDVIIRDEDIRMSISDGVPQDLSPVLKAPVYYLSGAGVWRKKTADDYPFVQSGALGMSAGVPVVIYTGADGRVAYNRLSGGVWSLAQVANNGYVLAHIYATTSWTEPVVAIAGQAVYTTIPSAQAGAAAELLALADLIKIFGPEAVPLASVIIQTADSYGNTPKARVVMVSTTANYYDWRGNKYKGGAGTNTQPLPIGTNGQVLQNVGGTVWQPQDYFETTTGGGGLAHTSGFLRAGPVDSIITAKLAAASSVPLFSTYDGGGYTAIQVGSAAANGVYEIANNVATSGRHLIQVNSVAVLAVNGSGIFAYQPLDMAAQKITSLGAPSATTDAVQLQNIYKQPAANIALGSGVTINDWSPTDIATLTHLICTGGPSAITITGIDSTGLLIRNKIFYMAASAVNVTFNYNDAGSAANNRIYTTTGGAVTVSATNFVFLFYDTIVNKWRLRSV